jgi:hypothetical protein
VQLAEERLAGTHVRVYLCGGKRRHRRRPLPRWTRPPRTRVVNCENRIVELDDEHVLATVGLLHADPLGDPAGEDR